MLRKVKVYLSKADIAFATAFGDGNRSAGVRKAIELAIETLRGHERLARLRRRAKSNRTRTAATPDAADKEGK